MRKNYPQETGENTCRNLYNEDNRYKKTNRESSGTAASKKIKELPGIKISHVKGGAWEKKTGKM